MFRFLGHIKKVPGFNMKTQVCVITFYKEQVACIKEKIKMNTLASNNSQNKQISLHSDPNKITSQRKKEQENKKQDNNKQIIHKINFEKMHLQS